MSFGGSVKLTGESEYRQAIKNCISSLQSMSTALKNQTNDFNSSDKAIKNSAAAQKQLNETIKTQQAELAKAKSSYAQYQVALQNQTTKHNLLNKEYKNAVTELERIKKASGENSTEYQKQAQVVDKLEKELIQSTEAMNETKTAMSSLKTEINNSNKTINNAEKALNDLGNEAEDSGKQAEKGSDGFTIMKGVLANLATKVITSAINGLKKLGSTAVSVGKQAIGSYAEYEQLVGGVETLFKDSASKVQEYASKAYKTAGMSANQYLEQATSFSASLLQGLGGDTAKAAEYADMAITDMSDNANKMGTSIEMLTNAYGGFAKQNYTMLDNLKLGYGGTKSEMARLVKESGILGDAAEDLTAKNLDEKVSFDQIIKAINITQQRMGITGTTAKEAASTIQGSVNSMKASWNNLLTAIADDNADLSKSVNEFVDSAIAAGKNIVPRIKQVVEGVKKLINSLITEVFPKLKKEIPQLAPLIDTFEWFIKNRQLVVTAVGAMVGAFAVSKILSFTKSMSDVIKSIVKAATSTAAATAATNANTTAQVANTTAQVAGATATGLLTKATNLLNAAWKANPIGLVITAVTALISVLGLFQDKTEEVTEAEKAQQEAMEKVTEKVKQSKEAWDSLSEAQQNQIDTGMTEMANTKNLYNELQSLVDVNGKVKEGYEGRASFILGELNKALGTEYTMTGNVINQYDNLKNSIDQVMEKKKAQIILDAQESLYAEAINKQAEAVKQLNDIEQMINDKRNERTQLEEERTKVEVQLASTVDSSRRALLKATIEAIDKGIAAKDEETANLQNNYNTQEGLLQEYAYNVGQYEQNMALFHEGKYSEMSNVNWNYVKDYQRAGDAEKAQLEDQVKNTEAQLRVLKGLKEKSGTDLYDSQIAANEKLLSEQKESLKKYTSTTDNELKNNQKTWLENTATTLSKLSDKNIEFKTLGDGQVQYYEDGIAQGKPMAVAEAEKVASDVLSKFDKEVEAKGAGENVITGFTRGEGNMSLQNTAFATARNFASSILSTLKSKLGRASPSKETKKMGQFLIEGFGLGMEDEENSVLKQATDFGKSLLGSLNTGISGAIKTSGLSDIQTNISGINVAGSKNTIEAMKADNYTNIVEAFKDALGQMTIELDDENMGKFIDKTVAKTIYS